MDWLKPNNDTESVDVQFENNGKWIAGDRNQRILETIEYQSQVVITSVYSGTSETFRISMKDINNHLYLIRVDDMKLIFNPNSVIEVHFVSTLNKITN